MAKVKNPQGIDSNESGKIGNVDFVKANLSEGFTHKANIKGLKPKKKKKDQKVKTKIRIKKVEWKGFDGCSICQAMENGEASTVEGLTKAFADANKSSGVTGFNPEFFQTAMGSRMAMRVPNKDDLYYDAMDALSIGDFKNTEKILNQALALDPDYCKTYLAFSYLYHDLGQKENTDESIRIAFEKIQKEFPKWPKEMHWDVLENRPYLRVIEKQAELYYDNGEIPKAEELYRLLLKLNPNDNQGVRYVLAGLYAGISGEEINKMTDEGNAKQDWSKLEKLVSVQNREYKFWKAPKN
jgi:tetratricopeptide (TPR) repeat protein